MQEILTNTLTREQTKQLQHKQHEIYERPYAKTILALAALARVVLFTQTAET